MSQTLEEWLEEQEKLCAAATPGEWWNESGVIHAKDPERWTPEVHSCCHTAFCENEDNAEFVAASRQSLPLALQIIRAIREWEPSLVSQIAERVIQRCQSEQRTEIQSVDRVV